MGSTRQKKLFDGLAPRLARKKFREIWDKARPDEKFPKNMYHWLETWHRLRANNRTLEAMITAFAESLAKRNKQGHLLSQTIHDQRETLAKMQHDLNTYKASEKRGQENGPASQSVKQEQALRQTPQVAEGQNAEVPET